MGSTLNVNIYGLKASIKCFGEEEKQHVSRLLSLFMKEEPMEVDITLDFRKKEMPQEIGGLLFPHLAGRGIWAMHSGGFHFHGGHLTLGPSDCGKSTFSHIAMKNGLDLLSDDITLLRATTDGIEMLPFYSTIFLKNGTVIPEIKRYKPATLKYLLLPKMGNGPMFLHQVKRKIDLLRKLVPQFLWSYNKSEQKLQERFLKMMCCYPAYEVHWGSKLFHDHSLFRVMLDEIVRSEG
jgi:hypothetical protein